MILLNMPKNIEVDEIWAIAREKNLLENLKVETKLNIRTFSIDLEKEKDKFSMNTKLKINNTIKDVKITVQVIYDGEEALGVLGDIEIL